MATFMILTHKQGEALDHVLSFARANKIDPKFKQLIEQRDRVVAVIADLYDKALDIEIEIEAELGMFDNPPKFEGDV
jgi:hypothetical protein